MGYAPAAARRALEATGSVEAAISALDPGYCAAVDTQQARGNANHLLRFTTDLGCRGADFVSFSSSVLALIKHDLRSVSTLGLP